MIAGNSFFEALSSDNNARARRPTSSGLSLLALEKMGYGLPVMECRLAYASPARYDDRLVVETWITEMDRLRVHFGYRVLHEDERVILTAQTDHVCSSLAGRPRRMPADLGDRLTAWVRPE